MKNLIEKISFKHFGVLPRSIIRMTTGICSEVYSVTLINKCHYIFRLNKNAEPLKGSEKYIPLFKSLGIKVPNIIASDYSFSFVPISYQILSLIPGKDLGQVFDSVTKNQLLEISKNIATIFTKVETLLTDGSFGSINFTGHGKFNSWTAAIESSINLAIKRGRQTGTLTREIEEILFEFFNKNKKYFDQTKSNAYYDDINGKNVMIHNGKFSGLVDLDDICYGDCLEAIGRIKANFTSRKNCDFYVNSIEKNLNLDKTDKKLVSVYALLNRIFWLTENGIKFNNNTIGRVNQDKMVKDQKIIMQLAKDIH